MGEGVICRHGHFHLCFEVLWPPVYCARPRFSAVCLPGDQHRVVGAFRLACVGSTLSSTRSESSPSYFPSISGHRLCERAGASLCLLPRRVRSLAWRPFFLQFGPHYDRNAVLLRRILLTRSHILACVVPSRSNRSGGRLLAPAVCQSMLASAHFPDDFRHIKSVPGQGTLYREILESGKEEITGGSKAGSRSFRARLLIYATQRF